jgi:hypothetical protein
VARIALCRELVRRLSEAAAGEQARALDRAVLRDGDLAVALLWAILRAAGERATVEYTREMPLVRVAVAFADVRLLPPWARLAPAARGRVEIAVSVDTRWLSAAYLPPVVRGALDLRRASRSRIALAS